MNTPTLGEIRPISATPAVRELYTLERGLHALKQGAADIADLAYGIEADAPKPHPELDAIAADLAEAVDLIGRAHQHARDLWNAAADAGQKGGR